MRVATLAVLLALPGVAVAAPKKKAGPKPAPTAAAPAPPDEGVNLAPTTTHTEGEYGGVTPGVPGKPEKKVKATKGTLSWIGFEAKNGGAEIFFQSVGPFDITQHVEGSVLVVNLGLSRLGQNTWREVDARFFDTPVARIVARHVGAARASKSGPGHGAGIEVRISFKDKTAHEGSLRNATESDGMYYAYLSLAGGGTAPEPDKN